MIIYYAFFASSIFFAWLSLIDLKKRKLRDRPRITLYCVSGLILALLLGLRKGVGTDFYTIYSFSYDLASDGYATRFEVGYDLINRALAFFGATNEVYFFVVALLTVGFVYRAIYEAPINQIWAIFVFQVGGLWFYATNGMRQALAVAILLNAIPCLIKGNIKKYIIWVVVASSVHLFSIIFLPLFFLRAWRIDSVKTVALLAIVFIFSGYIADIGLELASRLSSQFAAYTRIDRYNSSGDIDVSDLFLCLFPICLYFLSSKHVRASGLQNEVNSYFLLLLLGVLSSLLSANVFIFSRAASFFTPFSIVAMPYLFCVLEKGGVRYTVFVKVLYALILIGSSYYLFGVLKIHNAIPYVSVFDGGGIR